MVNLSIIIPTTGRPSLSATIESFAPDLQPGDQVIVMADDPDYHPVHGYDRDYPEVNWVFNVNRRVLGCFGHASRNYASDVFVTNPWVWSIDDDDVALPGALPAIRAAAESGECPWYVFKMTFGDNHRAAGATIWSFRNLIVGNVGTPMIVAPVTEAVWGTSPDLLCGDGYFGDFEYAQALQSTIGEPGWKDLPVALIRP